MAVCVCMRHVLYVGSVCGGMWCCVVLCVRMGQLLDVGSASISGGMWWCVAVCVCVRPVLDVDEIYVERCGGVWMCVVV